MGRLLAPLAAARGGRRRVRRVLLLRPDHVGDVLLTAPAVALLRASLPDVQITYLVGPWSAAAARGGPPVDDIRPLAFPGFTRHGSASLLAPYLLLARSAAMLRRERYDVAVVLRADHWWGALLASAAGIPIRVGADLAETRPLLTHARHLEPGEAWADQALETARLALRTLAVEPVDPGRVDQFTPGLEARATADGLWQQHGFTGRTVVAIHPSAGAPLKSWPRERWTRLADRLVDSGLLVALTGAPDDADLLSAIARGMRGRTSCAILCGQSLEVSAALYARCALVVSVDSGAGHLAAAVGTPSVRLYGPASAAVFGPWPCGTHQRVLATSALACAPCGFLASPPCGARSVPACMLALDVEDVLNAVSAELGRR